MHLFWKPAILNKMNTLPLLMIAVTAKQEIQSYVVLPKQPVMKFNIALAVMASNVIQVQIQEIRNPRCQFQVHWLLYGQEMVSFKFVLHAETDKT